MRIEYEEIMTDILKTYKGFGKDSIENIHTCKKSQGKIVCITIDNVGMTRCAYCNEIVDYLEYFKLQEARKVIEMLNKKEIKEFNLSEKRQDRKSCKTSHIYNSPYTYDEEDAKEFIKQAESKSDDAGHFQHDTKVIRLKDLKDLAGDKLIGNTVLAKPAPSTKQQIKKEEDKEYEPEVNPLGVGK